MTGRYQVGVRERVLQQEMYYKNSSIMKYTIKYPHFISSRYQTLVNKLNSLYRTKALMYERSNIMNLYQMAIVEYEYSAANNYPFRKFEAYVDYSVAYNQDGMLSLYFDQYEYAGGAHGLTIRCSDTWNMMKSKRMELRDFFPSCKNYREFLICEIIRQIKEEQDEEKRLYFEDIERKVRDKFRTNQYYLSEEGLIIYYQQYDIAPYAAGLPQFLIPYGADGAVWPKCHIRTDYS